MFQSACSYSAVGLCLFVGVSTPTEYTMCVSFFSFAGPPAVTDHTQMAGKS